MPMRVRTMARLLCDCIACALQGYIDCTDMPEPERDEPVNSFQAAGWVLPLPAATTNPYIVILARAYLNWGSAGAVSRFTRPSQHSSKQRGADAVLCETVHQHVWRDAAWLAVRPRLALLWCLLLLTVPQLPL